MSIAFAFESKVNWFRLWSVRHHHCLWNRSAYYFMRMSLVAHPHSASLHLFPSFYTHFYHSRSVRPFRFNAVAISDTIPMSVQHQRLTWISRWFVGNVVLNRHVGPLFASKCAQLMFMWPWVWKLRLSFVGALPGISMNILCEFADISNCWQNGTYVRQSQASSAFRSSTVHHAKPERKYVQFDTK